ncbi:MAG: hypothetical protein IH921_05845 [Gemmatimonadetes bacterium]|nr:hypothetical protein [Gemmatimonadota bacterium]
MSLEKPFRLKLPSPDARVARSPFEGAKDLFSAGGQAADSAFDFTGGNAANGETVTIAGKVYTFQTVLTDVDGNVQIGSTENFSALNLFDAINRNIAAQTQDDFSDLRPPFGEGYAAKTLAHPNVIASGLVFGSARFDVFTRFTGTAANSVAVTETVANAAWDNNPMENGANPDDEVRFVPIVQWGKIRIRVEMLSSTPDILGGSGVLGVAFVRPNRALDPALLPGAAEAFEYTLDQPAIDGTVLNLGSEVSLDITAAEHQGENWLKITLGSFTKSDGLGFLDISGELLGTYH